MINYSLNPASLGPWCALFSSVTWAIGSTGYSRLSKDYSAFAVNFARALIVLPLFIITVFFVGGGVTQGIAQYQQLSFTHMGWFLLSMIASYGIGDVLFLWSTKSLGVSGALAIASCYPVWTVLAAYFFSHEQLNLWQILGLSLTLLGVILVVTHGPQTSGIRQGSVRRGLFLAILTSLAWATNTYSIARGGVGIYPPVGNSARMFLALIFCPLFARILAPKDSILLPPKQLIKSLWFIIAEGFLGSCLYMYGLSHSPLALGSSLSSLAPVICVPIALLFGIEKFSAFRSLGVVLAGTGIWFLLGAF